MGRGSPVCQQIREKIIEMFKNNVPQRKIGRDLDISPSTVHMHNSVPVAQWQSIALAAQKVVGSIPREHT